MVILAKRVLSCEEDNPLYNCVLENSTNTGDLEHDQSVYECLHDVSVYMTSFAYRQDVMYKSPVCWWFQYLCYK